MQEEVAKLPTKLWAVLRREALLAEGRAAAFNFAIECEGDLRRLEAKVGEEEDLIANTGESLRAAMASGAGPRTYHDGYLTGIREAVQIIAEMQPESRGSTDT